MSLLRERSDGEVIILEITVGSFQTDFEEIINPVNNKKNTNQLKRVRKKLKPILIKRDCFIIKSTKG